MDKHTTSPNQTSSRVSRRNFLKNTLGFTFAIGASGMITACANILPSGASPESQADPLQPNIWVSINPDNTIVVKYAGTEMGQGSMTHVPMMLAEHLDADWDKVQVEIVKVHDTAFGNPVFQNNLYTAGSTQVAIYGKKMAIAGTQARKLLLTAVAGHWGVNITELTTEPSLVLHKASGRKISYGEIVGSLTIPTAVPEIDKSEIKPKSEYRYIGKQLMRRDVPPKTNGTAHYGMDVQVPGMAYAAIFRSPVEGERPLRVDEREAKQVKGITDIVTLPYGVALVGDTVEATKKAKSLLKVTWSKDSPFRNKSSDTTLLEYSKNAKDLGITGPTWGKPSGEAKAVLADADEVMEALYTSDAAYHGQMEPLNATASVSADGKSAEIWVGTQSQSMTILGAAETLGTDPANITIHPLLMGGSFGRRTELHQQYVDDALLVSKALKQPIKVIWSREDDLEVGAFRTAAAQYLRGAFDQNGNLLAIHHRVGAPNVIPSMNKYRWEAVQPRDVITMMGSENSTYDIPNHLAEHIVQERGSRVVAWRGVGSTYTKFAIESFIDELAHNKGIDPLAFRLQLCHKNPRMTKVLRTVAEMAEWSRPRPEGVALGIAISGYHKSLSAGIAEVSLDKNTGEIKVHKYWAVGDAGYIVAPKNAEAQLLGNVIFGLSSALKERVVIKNGVVQNRNYYDYQILRLNELPEIETQMLSNDLPSTGVGELGTAMTAPSIANAIHALTGKRVRHMPLTNDIVLSALRS